MTNTSPTLRDSDKEFIRLVYKGLPNAKRDVRRLKLRDAGPTGFGLLYGGGLRGGSLRDKGTPTGRNIRAILKRKEYEDMLVRIENKYPGMSLEDIAKEEEIEVGIKKGSREEIETPYTELYGRPRLARSKGFTDRLGTLGPEDINSIYLLEGNKDMPLFYRFKTPSYAKYSLGGLTHGDIRGLYLGDNEPQDVSASELTRHMPSDMYLNTKKLDVGETNIPTLRPLNLFDHIGFAMYKAERNAKRVGIGLGIGALGLGAYGITRKLRDKNKGKKEKENSEDDNSMEKKAVTRAFLKGYYTKTASFKWGPEDAVTSSLLSTGAGVVGGAIGGYIGMPDDVKKKKHIGAGIALGALGGAGIGALASVPLQIAALRNIKVGMAKKASLGKQQDNNAYTYNRWIGGKDTYSKGSGATLYQGEGIPEFNPLFAAADIPQHAAAILANRHKIDAPVEYFNLTSGTPSPYFNRQVDHLLRLPAEDIDGLLDLIRQRADKGGLVQDLSHYIKDDDGTWYRKLMSTDHAIDHAENEAKRYADSMTDIPYRGLDAGLGAIAGLGISHITSGKKSDDDKDKKRRLARHVLFTAAGAGIGHKLRPLHNAKYNKEYSKHLDPIMNKVQEIKDLNQRALKSYRDNFIATN